MGAKKQAYRIVAGRQQYFEFEVVATSPENACKRLYERLRRNNALEAPDDRKNWTSAWLDPSDKGDAWLIAGGELPQDPTAKTSLYWDGKEIKRGKLVE